MRQKRPRNLDQEFYIKRLLAERGLSMAALARAIGAPPGSLPNNIYGYRIDPDLQARIADYLDLPVEKLFPGNGQEPPAAEREPVPRGKPGGRFLRAVVARAKQLIQTQGPAGENET